MIIRDKKKVIEKIEKVLAKHKDDIAWVKIDKVEIPNKWTGNIDVLENVYIYATNKGSDRPKIICGYRDSRNMYILHDEIAHINVGGNNLHTLPNSRCNRFIDRAFCNPVHEYHIWQDPIKAKHILKGNLTDTNPMSPMRSHIKSTNITSSAYLIYNNYTGDILKNDASLEQMIARTYDLTVTTDGTKQQISEKRKYLKEHQDECYAYVTYDKSISPSYTWTFVKKSDIEDNICMTQDYYKSYDYTDIDDSFVIPKSENDVCCLGLGSAGSNILEQLIKLNYFDRYTIVDFDRVEKKNLRNQMCAYRYIGSYKVSSMSNYMEEYNALENSVRINSYSRKYEHVDFTYMKFKYVISGFDNIPCRLGVLDKVKSNELETQYIIDARYDGLTCSLYFIDTSDKDQMEYYEKMLHETAKELEANEKVDYNWTTEDVRRHYSRVWLNGGCSEFTYNIGLTDTQYNNLCQVKDCYRQGSCGSTRCLELLANTLKQCKVPRKTEEGCLAQNIIHIYKLASTWVTSAINSLETDKKKYFTHVDMTVDPVPNAIIIKK